MRINNDLPAGEIAFYSTDNKELMRFTHTGEVIIRGEKVDDNQAVYLALKDFINGGLELYKRAVNAENELNLLKQERSKITAHCEYCPGIDKPHGPPTD